MFSQADSSQRQGTIKIVKQKSGPVYIKASADFGIKGPDSFQPFPVVEGYSFPFNYTRYFRERFKTTKVDLQGKNTDTVYMEVKISKKGKVYIKDVTNSVTNGKRSYLDTRESSYVSALHLHCFNFLHEINEWFPAYDIDPKVDKYKGQTVIRPEKITKDATGLIMIAFSYEPFDQ
jgi:hypothetical protein